MSSPEISRPGLDHVLDRNAVRAEMLLQRETLARRIAEAELELRCGIEPAVGEIAARLGAVARRRACPGRISPQAPSRRAASCAARRAPRPRARPSAAARRPSAPGARPLPESSRLRVSITKSKMLPFLPEEKSNQACFWSFTKKDGVFSLLNGDRPLNSRPERTSFTRRPTTSDTGRRAFSSSRNCGVKRMGFGRIGDQPVILPHIGYLGRVQG